MSNLVQDFQNSASGAMKGFQNPDQTLQGDTNPVNRFLDTIPGLKNIRAANEGAFGREAVNNPQLSWSGEMNTGMFPRDAVGRFATNRGYNVPMHPDDISEASPAIERVLTRQDLPYHTSGQLQQDSDLLNLLGKHYIGNDFIKMNAGQPQNIAQELLNRIMIDRPAIPK